MRNGLYAKLFVAAMICFPAVVTQGQLSVSNFFTYGGAPGAPHTLYVLAGTNLYGIGSSLGPTGNGAVFSASTTGRQNWVYAFPSAVEASSLILGDDGNLYGTGAVGKTVFSLTTNGVQRWLVPLSVGQPTAPLVAGRDGNLYGTAGPGAVGLGTPGVVFCLTNTGAVTWSVSIPNTGLLGQMIQGAEGNLYAVAGIHLVSAATNDAGAVVCVGTNRTLKWVFSFSSTNGSDPASLIQGADGSLYGTTTAGGAQNFGTVFCLSTNGQMVWSYSFPTSLQAYPLARLIQGPYGRLYGATGRLGNSFNNQPPASAGGTVFCLTTNGTPVWSYAVATNTAEVGGLLAGMDGNLYGVAVPAIPTGNILFSITTNGIWNGSATFAAVDAAYLDFALFQGSDATIYGAAGQSLFRAPLSLAIARQPVSATNVTGQSASFISTAVSAAPPSYQWQKNGTNLTDNGTVSGSQTCVLEITNSALADAGNYTLVASNSFGVVTSSVAILTIIPSPLEFTPPTVADGTVTLSWSAQPQHTYQVQWTADFGASHWQNLGSPIANASGNITITDSIGGLCRFYRIVQVQ